MIGVLHADPAGAEALGHVHGEAIGVRADDESEAVVAIDCGGGWGGGQHLYFLPGIDWARGEQVEVYVQARKPPGGDGAPVGGSSEISHLCCVDRCENQL